MTNAIVEVPTDATNVACADPTADLNAANRVKGFLGMTGEIVPSLPADPVAHVKALTDTELFSAGEKALRDIADDIIILDEIRNRFRAANGPILGYQSWKDFVEKNSIYSIRTIQRRLNEATGTKDETKINDRYKAEVLADTEPVLAESEPTPTSEDVNPPDLPDPEIAAVHSISEPEPPESDASVFEDLISTLYSLTKSGPDGVEHKFVRLLENAASYLTANPNLDKGAENSRNTVIYLLNRVAKEFQEHALMLSKTAVTQ